MPLSRVVEFVKRPFLRTRAGTGQAAFRWLVISNCQTVGLANCLSLLCPQARIDACNLWQLRKHARRWKARLGDYDRLFFAPQVKDFGLPDLEGQTNITWVPSVIFGGFHPDLCYISHGKGFLKGPLDDYHSLIAITAYKQGLSPAQTTRLYRQEVFERLGYFESWNAERAQLFADFADFAAVGWDIRDEFLRWVRKGVFMHSPNHPHIDVLYDQARRLLAETPGLLRDGGCLPHDNLATGPVFPVFPEVAERLGLMGGAYLFKPLNEYRLLDLEAYLEACFAVYAKCDKAALKPQSACADRAVGVIAEEA